VEGSSGTRVGFASPNLADAELALRLLAQSGVHAEAFGNLLDLAAAVDGTMDCLVLVEEALVAEEIPALGESLAGLPAWCDLPLIVVAGDVEKVSDTVAEIFPAAGNVTLLGRPLSPHTLVSAVRVALRASARQREMGALMLQREQAVQRRDEFLAMLAHELRNPLAPMRNALYILRAAKSDDARVGKCAEVLDRQVDHMVRLVDDLLDVARLERGKVVLQRQRVDLNQAVTMAIQNCLTLLRSKGHRLNLRLETQPLLVDVDAVRLEQIVCNLLNNAAKFTTRPDEISVETYQRAGDAHLAVEDRGIGFEPAKAKDLFDPFLQVNNSLERNEGGLGIGLTIVKRLAELHGGSVEATSAGPGKGARFVVRLPIGAAAAEPRTHDERPVVRPRRRRVVVVEDNPDIRHTLEILLEMWGHEFATAGDGLTGLELVLRYRPQVAFIDIGLPGMSGYDVARHVRERLKDGEILLVAVTGYGQTSDRDLAQRAGFDAHLAKPIDPRLLERMLAGDGPLGIATTSTKGGGGIPG
jgi:signal transduction histidine kinase/CheY-like chemotaxis protein